MLRVRTTTRSPVKPCLRSGGARPPVNRVALTHWGRGRTECYSHVGALAIWLFRNRRESAQPDSLKESSRCSRKETPLFGGGYRSRQCPRLADGAPQPRRTLSELPPSAARAALQRPSKPGRHAVPTLNGHSRPTVRSTPITGSGATNCTNTVAHCRDYIIRLPRAPPRKAATPNASPLAPPGRMIAAVVRSL
jgi:hypothetical protein